MVGEDKEGNWSVNKAHKVLFIGAHQDDIACIAGTAINLKRAGCQLNYICTTDSRYGSVMGRNLTPQQVTQKLNSAARVCCRLIGIDDYVNLNYEDGFYHYSEKTVKEITSLIRKYRPDMVFTNWPIDNHPDHANTTKVAERAVTLANSGRYGEGREAVTGCKVLALYFHQAGFRQTVNCVPDLYVDVSDVMDEVEEVVKTFTTPKTTERFIEFIRMRHKLDGKMIGKEYAEAIAQSKLIGRSWAKDPLIQISNKVNFPFLI